MRKAIRKIGTDGRAALQAAETDLSPFLELASGSLSEHETATLYGLLRVRELLSAYVERLGVPMLDHDLLAEMCDEESAILVDYFEFPAQVYRRVRDVAIDSGALGAKLTYAFGDTPAVVVLAPGRRDAVCDALKRELVDCCCLAVDVAPVGAASSL